MNEQQPPLAWLESRMLFGMKAGLENITTLCERLGNPQARLRTLHVVGTNGKGSTSFWLMRILEAYGLRVGLFTSPHLVSMRERIRVGDVPISTADQERLLDTVRRVAGSNEVTFFEALTAVALAWFAEQKTDVVVLEAGLGGRLDSTNVVHSEMAILTSIGFDHTEILGDTLPKILSEKIGVWKSGSPLFYNLCEDSLRALVAQESSHTGKPAYFVPADRTLVLPQAGKMYQENASLAMACARQFLGTSFQESLARQTLASAVWAGRQQDLHDPQTGAVRWILDGAHNGHAALRLAETLRTKYPSQKLTLVMAILKTKNPEEIIAPLLPFVSSVILTRTPHPKMREPAELASLFPSLSVQVVPSVAQALLVAQGLPSPTLCTGSLYFVGAVIEELKDQYSELAWFRQFAPDNNELK